MKRIFIAIILIFSFALFSCGKVQTAGQVLGTDTATSTPKPTSCWVYAMKSWFEVGQALDGSFSQIPASDGGVNTKLLLGLTEITLIKNLNIQYNPMWNTGTSIGSWAWAADAPQGKYYQSITGVSIDSQVWWNWVGQPSPDQRIYPNTRNYMCVSKISGGYAYVVGLPKGIDYSKYLYLDWIVQKVYGNWENQKPDGTWAGMPVIWDAIMFDPASGFQISAKSDKTFRFPQSWLYQFIRTDVIPWNVPATSTPTVTPTFTVTSTSTQTNTPTATSTFTPTVTVVSTITPTRTPECHLFLNINHIVCVP